MLLVSAAYVLIIVSYLMPVNYYFAFIGRFRVSISSILLLSYVPP